MQHIIASLANKHGLTRAEIMAEVEDVFAAQRSQWYRLPVMVFLRDDRHLDLEAYNNGSGQVIMQRLLDLSKIKGRGTLSRQLMANLAKAAFLAVDRELKERLKAQVVESLP